MWCKPEREREACIYEAFKMLEKQFPSLEKLGPAMPPAPPSSFSPVHGLAQQYNTDFSSFRKGNINSKVCKHALRKRERGVNDDYLTFLGKWNEREREKRGTRKARQHHTPLSPLSFDIFLSLFSSVLIVINFSFSAPMHEKLVLSLSLINSNILNIIPFIHSFMHHHPSCIQTC